MHKHKGIHPHLMKDNLT